MSSLTIHNLDELVARELKNRAKVERVSVNALVKRLLSESLGIKVSQDHPHKKDFAEFLGFWSEKDAKEFDDNISDLLTKSGKPVAQVLPTVETKPVSGKLSNTLVFEEDIVSPLGEKM